MEEHKMEMKELEEVCKPIVEFLKKRHPYCSITVDADTIKLNETVIGVPTRIID